MMSADQGRERMTLEGFRRARRALEHATAGLPSQQAERARAAFLAVVRATQRRPRALHVSLHVDSAAGG